MSFEIGAAEALSLPAGAPVGRVRLRFPDGQFVAPEGWLRVIALAG